MDFYKLLYLSTMLAAVGLCGTWNFSLIPNCTHSYSACPGKWVSLVHSITCCRPEAAEICFRPLLFICWFAQCVGKATRNQEFQLLSGCTMLLWDLESVSFRAYSILLSVSAHFFKGQRQAQQLAIVHIVFCATCSKHWRNYWATSEWGIPSSQHIWANSSGTWFPGDACGKWPIPWYTVTVLSWPQAYKSCHRSCL